MADSLRSTTPVSAAGGFAGRAPTFEERHGPSQPAVPQRAADRVDVEGAALVARRVLRERVMARTREGLELTDGEHGVAFAEAIETEPVAQFLGRLLSAQNQLAAWRLPTWGGPKVRRALDAALRQGATEALDLLTADGRDDGTAANVVAEVLADYGRRLAALVEGPGPAAG